MSKNTINNRPSVQKPVTPRGPKTTAGAQPAAQPAAPASSAKAQAGVKKADKKDRPSAQQLQRPQRIQRPQRAHGAAPAAGAGHGAAESHDEDALGQAGLGGVEAGSAADELSRRRASEGDLVQEEHELEEHEEAHETGATGPDAIKRSKGGDAGGDSDGFEGRDGQREAYERYMRGNVRADQERFDELRRKGAKDDFSPTRPALEVEALGTNRATAHVVRLYEAWTLEGMGRTEALQKAASFLAEFRSAQNIRKVLAELESKPIRDVYPLEVLMKLLDERPELLPGVRAGSVIGNAAELLDGKKVLAGYPAAVQVPQDVRLKSFALLGGARPGYEFAPAVEEGKYTLLVDTPGEWAFAVLAAPLQQLGRIQRETQEAILEIFRVTVHAMGKKGEPLTPEEWRALHDFDDEGEGDGEPEAFSADDDADHPDGMKAIEQPPAPPAANLAVQIRTQLDRIRRDDVTAGTPAAATTYSWDASFFRPGAPAGADPLLHLVVERAGPFDAAWSKARDALAQKQREFEPGRATVTAEDFTAALRRARVR